jgi:hypothetical protein
MQARLALALPVLSWLSQIIVALYVRGAPAEFYLLAAVTQGVLLVGGMLLGIWALFRRGRGGLAVVVPATLGLLLSVGTLLLIGIVTIVSLLQ